MNVKKTKKFKENRPENYHVHDSCADSSSTDDVASHGESPGKTLRKHDKKYKKIVSINKWHGLPLSSKSSVRPILFFFSLMLHLV